MKIFRWRTVLYIILSFFSCQTYAVSWEHYERNPDFIPDILPNGAVTNFSDWKKVLPQLRIGPGVEIKAQKISDGVWMFDGKFYAPVVIETKEGLLVFSTGENAEEGRLFRKLIREQISKKAIIGVFYDHAHYPYGAATLLDGDKAIIVAHPDHEKIIHQSGHLVNPIIPEMLPHLDARANIHFGVNHPKKGPDAAISATTLDLGKEQAWLPPTHTLKHGEFITVGGMKIQAFHATTDTEDSLTFWIPEKKTVIDNVLWPTIPNIYTLRGDRYRPPELWIKALKDIRKLNAEIELNVGGGSKALIGADTVLEASNALIDALSFIYDQTIRLTNLGVPIYELAHHIDMPASLKKHPFVNEVYGQYEHHIPRIVESSHGWFSGRGEDIHQLPRAIFAKKFIKLVGGKEKMMAAYQEAISKGEYLWAKSIAINLYYTNQESSIYRKALADVFRKLGEYSYGTIARNFYTASALSLEGNNNFTLASVPKVEWIKDDYARAVNHLRTRINPKLAANKNGVILFDIDGTIAALHIRNSIAEFLDNPNKHYRDIDASIRVSGDYFIQYFRGEISASQLLIKASASEGASELLNMFDAFKPIPMYPKKAI